MMNHELVIGKYTLESLTNGLYASPLDLYREYIQNAADSIDVAIVERLERPECFEIAINMNYAKNMVTIFDNGHGLCKKEAISTLLDIGNSNKQRTLNRGFRGIGRLAGLGYCDELVFVTSFAGEATKTIIHYNAKLLRELLVSSNENSISVQDVINQIVSVEEACEKVNRHYFEVKMIGVASNSGLMDEDAVSNYLTQHAPIPFKEDFKWGSTVQEKLRISGYTIPTYCICLNGEELYKPYSDRFVSDRVKKITDRIQDIRIKKFYRGEILSAILWYAHTSFYGTITDNSIKGIRVRQGNILIGDKSTCSSYFKEERFNGWIIGELHVLDPEMIVNSRRDDFEKNDAYYELIKMFEKWAISISKDIRSISYERNLSREKKAVVEAESIEDVNNLCCEDYSYAEDVTESDFLDSGDSEMVAEMGYMDKLSLLIDQKKAQTRYRALNINSKLTIEQRKVLERVFDLIQQEYDAHDAEKFINIIASNF